MTASLTQVLTRAPLCAGLSPESIELISYLGDTVDFERGATIFEYNDEGDTFFFVLEGRVRICMDVPGMGEELLTMLSPGDMFGELAVLDNTRRSATARAQERCRLHVITRAALEELLLMRKDISLEMSWNLVRILGDRLRDVTDKLAAFGAATHM